MQMNSSFIPSVPTCRLRYNTQSIVRVWTANCFGIIKSTLLLSIGGISSSLLYFHSIRLLLLAVQNWKVACVRASLSLLSSSNLIWWNVQFSTVPFRRSLLNSIISRAAARYKVENSFLFFEDFQESSHSIWGSDLKRTEQEMVLVDNWCSIT